MTQEFKGTKNYWFLVSVNAHPTNICEQVAFIQTYSHTFEVIADENSVLNRETFTANAQLIAHAPEMLEMLKHCNDLFIKRQYPTESEMKQASERIAELITKATTP